MSKDKLEELLVTWEKQLNEIQSISHAHLNCNNVGFLNGREDMLINCIDGLKKAMEGEI